MTDFSTHDIDAVAGATYFIVGRGTEGGPSSYHLSITGITVGTSDPHWGAPGNIVADSGYTLGTIQVDLGKRGTWALGATDGATPKPGESTYVDGIIDQASQFSKDHDLKFTDDKAQLRSDLLSHGNGKNGRDTLSFIDTDTRDSINAWAGSEEGQKWIHKNIDYPQIKNASQSAMDILEKYGKNIPDDRRLETIAILAKTENQIPSQIAKFEKVLKDGGDYDDVLAKASQIKNTYSYYDGPKAAAIAEEYKNAYRDPDKAAALDRAHVKVADPDFNPKRSADDPDVNEALKAIGQGDRSHAAHSGILRQGAHGENVAAMQTELAKLGFTDAHGRPLKPDGDFGPGTKAAVEKLQHAYGVTVDGVVGEKTREALSKAAHPAAPSLSDATSPGHVMYNQALEGIHAIDARHGRTPDQMSNNFAGSLVAAAQANGMTRIDHVAMSDDNKRAYAVQGDLNSPFKQIAEVEVSRAVATPLEQSSATFQALQQSQQQQQPMPPPREQPAAPTQPEPQPMHR
jgi:peptidoglycan hydrolase-like protein with peptidoglycan-binding domain